MMWIRINIMGVSSIRIRIRLKDADPDPGGKNRRKGLKKILKRFFVVKLKIYFLKSKL